MMRIKMIEERIFYAIGTISVKVPKWKNIFLDLEELKEYQ